jgi:hypothetical protein
MNFPVTGSKKPFATAYTVGSESFFPVLGSAKRPWTFLADPIQVTITVKAGICLTDEKGRKN